MRRKDREVTDRTVIDEIIRSCDCIRLGLNDSGEVYIVPMNFGFEHDGEKRVFYMHCAKEGRKLDIIRENPRIGFELDCGYKTLITEEACECTAGYRSVIGTGHIEILTETKDKVTGLDSLMKKINDILNEGTKTVTFVLPYSDGHVLQTLYRDANVLRADYIAEGIEVEAVCDKKALGRIRQYLPESEWREKEPWEE